MNGRRRLPIAAGTTAYARASGVPHIWRRGFNGAPAARQSSVHSITLFVSLNRLSHRSIATSAPLFTRKGAKPLPVADDGEEDEDEDGESDGWRSDDEGEGQDHAPRANSLQSADEKRRRLLNSKRRDINKKGVTYQGDIGPATAGAGVQLNADDDGEDDLVMVDGQGDHYEDDDDGTEGEEALEGDDDDDDDDEEGDGEEARAEQGVPPGEGPKAKTRDRRRVVPEGDADMRLDRWLKLQLPHLPNSLFQKLLRKRKAPLLPCVRACVVCVWCVCVSVCVCVCGAN